MKKKNGFTVVELIVSFTLVMVIVVFLFQIIISLKEMYVGNGIKSSLLNKQAVMTQKIYDDFRNKNVLSFSSCGTNCITLTFDDTTTSTLKIDKDQNLFEYGDYATKLVDGSTFGDIVLSKETLTGVGNGHYDSMVKIIVPIQNQLIKGDYGVTAIYQYNSNVTSIS